MIGLIVIALVLVVMFVDPNDYRDDIQRIVEQKTGRELKLSGDLKLSVFPWIALETGAATLGDAPGFGPEPFVSIKEARVRRPSRQRRRPPNFPAAVGRTVHHFLRSIFR